MTWSPEARLLLACARLHLDAASRAVVQETLRGTLDWSRVLAYAQRHCLRPLLHLHLGGVAPELVPRPVLVDLWAGYERGLRRNRTMARELASIVQALERAGIPALPYKGPTLAVAVYGDLGLREFADLDILVPAAEAVRGKALLERMGYSSDYALSSAADRAMMDSGAQYHVLLRGAPAEIVELHWRTDADFAVERPDADWWERLPHEPFEQVMVRAFPPSELFLVLCIHGSKHRWGALSWLVDIAEILRRDAMLDWEAIVSRAHALGAAKRLYLGLHLAHELLEAPLPEELREACTAPDIKAIASEICIELFNTMAVHHSALEMLRRDLALYDHRAHKLRHAVQVIASPSLVEWSRWPLPRPLFFLYSPLRLVRLVAKYAGPRRSVPRSGAGTREPRLPPRLINDDRDGVRQVEAAVPGTHRQA